ncbi:hypothetical protein LG322_03745 [Microbacterium aerolatum]|uniref:hypothetical protein n=1 Tax=Microbacterium aerolatum TaxID=153731 RepID=UPI00384DEF32
MRPSASLEADDRIVRCRDKSGEATALLDGSMHEGDVIAVTVEQAGGSPTGLPTTEPIIAIPTA